MAKLICIYLACTIALFLAVVLVCSGGWWMVVAFRLALLRLALCERWGVSEVLENVLGE